MIAAFDFIRTGLKLTHSRQLADLPWVALPTFYQNAMEFTYQTTGERVRVEFQTRMRADNLDATQCGAPRHGYCDGLQLGDARGSSAMAAAMAAA